MKNILYILFVAVALVSCKDDFDINEIKTPQKLVLYCFPSTADTTYIRVYESVPLDTAKREKVVQCESAQVKYLLNGKSVDIKKDSTGNMFAVAKQNPGDVIEIEASAKGFPDAKAKIVIPEAVDINYISSEKVSRYNPEEESNISVDQIKAKFTDNPNTQDFYAVQVLEKRFYSAYAYDYNKGGSIVISGSYFLKDKIYVMDEPALDILSNMDTFFGFESDIRDYFYVFSDRMFNGKTYTLHLDVAYSDDSDDEYQVLLYKITPEYYRFVNSVNSNNEWSKYGLAQISPTFTNVKGGLGLCGAYSVSHTEWFKMIK